MSHKLTVYRGTSFAITVHYLKNDVPATLVGATIRFTVKTTEFDTTVDDSTAIFKLNVTSHVDAAGGISKIQLVPADTATLTPTDYFYDIKVKEAGGAVYTLESGVLRLEASATNRTAP